MIICTYFLFFFFFYFYSVHHGMLCCVMLCNFPTEHPEVSSAEIENDRKRDFPLSDFRSKFIQLISQYQNVFLQTECLLNTLRMRKEKIQRSCLQNKNTFTTYYFITYSIMASKCRLTAILLYFSSNTVHQCKTAITGLNVVELQHVASFQATFQPK